MGSENSEVRTVINKFLQKWCEKNKRKISCLKLTGSLEDYLVKELAYQFLTNRFRVYLNMGARRRKIDMCIISKTGKNNTYQIRALIEVKYLSNAHWDVRDSARFGWEGRYETLITQLGTINNNTSDNLKGIREKMKLMNKTSHPDMDIIWKDQEVEVYGLIFVGAIIGTEKDKEFLKSINDVVDGNFKVKLETIFELDRVGFYGAVCEKQ